MLTPPSLHHTPERYVRPDGSSRLHPESRIVYTTEALLGAEARLLEAARKLGAPRVSVTIVAEVTERTCPGATTTERRPALAVEKIATSGRVLEVLIGRGRTGKSTAMAGLRAVWEQVHGPGSVIGLAPPRPQPRCSETSSGSRQRTPQVAHRVQAHPRADRTPGPSRLEPRRTPTRVLRARPGSAPNSQKRPRHLERRLKPGQLVMIDESSLAGPSPSTSS